MVSTARSAAAQQPMLVIVCSYLTGDALDDALRQVAKWSDCRNVYFEPVAPKLLTLKDQELRQLCSDPLFLPPRGGTRGKVAVLTHQGSQCGCSELRPLLKPALREFAHALGGWRYRYCSAEVSALEYRGDSDKPLRLICSASTRPGWKLPLY
ncbi:MAG: hypothetical protein JWN01_495 [Patescibacteria group bacterium]|nr:hypothetical protein [Patescibacteria group bacterium]